MSIVAVGARVITLPPLRGFRREVWVPRGGWLDGRVIGIGGGLVVVRTRRGLALPCWPDALAFAPLAGAPCRSHWRQVTAAGYELPCPSCSSYRHEYLLPDAREPVLASRVEDHAMLYVPPKVTRYVRTEWILRDPAAREPVRASFWQVAP